MNRIDRLTAILIHLQTKRIVKAEEISDRFEISLRTVYRDVKALMEAGVPIGSEAGKGYFIVDGFHLPPVMFTQDEANSMMLAGKLVDKMADKSVRSAFDSALYKIKAVLNEGGKDDLQNLEPHIEVFLRSRYEYREENTFPDHFLADIQRAIAKKHILKMEYSNREGEDSERCVEPVGIFYYSMAWYLIGWCHMREGYRNFRADRIKSLEDTGKTFEPRSTISLQEHFQSMYRENQNLTKVVALFDKTVLRNRPLYGSTAQQDMGEKIQAEFMVDQMDYMTHLLLLFGTSVEIIEPEELKIQMQNIANSLQNHYSIKESVAER